MLTPPTEEWARAAYQIAIEECGARSAPDMIEQFVRYATRYDQGEWRFIGALGFGGKLYFDRRGFRVGYYRENRTPEREAMVVRANERLAALRPASPEP